MNFQDYQAQSAGTAIYPNAGLGQPDSIAYVLLGLTGEVGEVANKYKKILRGDFALNQINMNDIAFELGDVLWYVSMLATELGWDLETLAEHNLQKLNGRKARGMLQGNGDDR